MSSFLSATNDSLFGIPFSTSAASTTPPASTANRPSSANPQPNLSSSLASTLQRSDFAGNAGKRDASVLFGLSQRPNAQAGSSSARLSAPAPSPSPTRNLYRATNSGTRAGSLVGHPSKSVLVRHSSRSTEAAPSQGPSRSASAPRSSGSSRGIPKPASALVKGAEKLSSGKSEDSSSASKHLSQGLSGFLKFKGSTSSLPRPVQRAIVPTPRNLPQFTRALSFPVLPKLNPKYLAAVVPFFRGGPLSQSLKGLLGRIIPKALMKRSGASGRLNSDWLRKQLRRRLRRRWLKHKNSKHAARVSSNISRNIGKSKTADLKGFY